MRSILLPAGRSEEDTDDIVQRALRAVRTHLGMEVAYISEIEGDASVFRYVDAPGAGSTDQGRRHPRPGRRLLPSHSSRASAGAHSRHGGGAARGRLAEAVLSGKVRQALDGVPLGQIALEITENAPVEDYHQLLEAMRPLREQGLRLAVDDAGAGYSTPQHVLCLRPDLIKLDMSLTRSIDTDTARRALAAALIGFASDTGSRIIAEGVETASEMAALRLLGVEKAQGYFISPPLPLDEAVALFSAREAQKLRPVA